MRLTYKYRIYPTKNQRIAFEHWIDTCRILYNNSLQERKEFWEKDKKSISYVDQANQLKKSKKSNPFLQEVYSQVLQDVLKRLDKSFNNFFRRIKNKENPGYPRFQGKDRYDSFTYPQYIFQIKDNKIKLPKTGYVKIKLHRVPKGKIKTLTVKRYINQWYVMLVSELPDKEKIKEIKSKVGIDLGLERFAGLSDGNVIENPRHLKTFEDKLKKEQRRLSRKKLRSSNRKKQKTILAKVHRKIRNQRNNFCHKESRKLVNNYDLLVLEDLKVKEMLQIKNPKWLKRRLNRSMNDVSWKIFTNFCTYKAENAGKYVEFVDPRNTSKTCSKCGNKKNDLGLWERNYICDECDYKVNRDLNASRNILKRSKIGKDIPESTPVEILIRESLNQEAYEL